MSDRPDNAESALIVAGRACGSCTLCCKVMEIGELGKAAGQWCPHVLTGKGCSIYAERPHSCSAFGCGWLHWKEAGDHWLPAKAKMVIVAQDRTRLVVHVDPATPNVWKAAPFYPDLKRWARNPARYGFRQVLVAVGRRMIAVLPDRELDLGEVPEEAIIATLELGGGRFSARVIMPDDPQFAALKGTGDRR
ncbi:hypothetical protein [Novosphingobium sp.]|uniref:hypothetical protein n=1 Tax=Novosphingobium sp. TaxID=1874826 RepID=UPI00286E8EB5|nr:hypothetical protein [Novosphingobium sp.]